jgi:neutral amino acid transport system permease protein
MALADFFVSLLTFVAIYSLFGVGLNVKYGFTGLIDFGHVAYFMIGAYVTVVLTMPRGGGTTYEGLGGFALPALLPFPGGGFVGWIVAVVVAMAAAAVVSLLVGIPTLRLREDYLAITALGIATILNAVVDNERWLFNGAFGVREVYQPLAGVAPVSTGNFQLNLLVFGVPSLAVLGFLLYRTARVVRPLDPRPAIVTTAAVAALAGGFVGLITPGTLTGVAGVGGLVVSVLLARRALVAAERVEPALALAATELFVLWYVVSPVFTDGVVDLVLNLLWLFDPNAGPAGGLDYDRLFLLLCLALLAGAYWWVQRTVNSPYGRVLRAIREDETVAEALGKRTVRYKLQALGFGSALAGAAGGLWAANLGFIDPTQFASTVTFFAFTAVIIGGTANNRGVVLGTVVFWVINSGTRFLDDFFPAEYAIQLAATRLMLIGVLLIVILYYRPEGILGEQSYAFGVDGGDGGGDDDGGGGEVEGEGDPAVGHDHERPVGSPSRSGAGRGTGGGAGE